MNLVRVAVLFWPTGLSRRYSAGRLVALLLMSVGLATLAGCQGDSDPTDDSRSSDSRRASIDIEGFRPKVDAFCGACHAVPDPASFPRDAWYKEVEQGYQFYYKSKNKELQAPAQAKVVEWYRAQAPVRLTIVNATSESGDDKTPRGFQLESIESPDISFPAISQVAVLGSESSTRPAEILILDMFHGQIAQLHPAAKDQRIELAPLVKPQSIKNPAHIERTDLDGDGQDDYVIAELGSFQPQDHAKGQVVWYSPRKESIEVLWEDVGRVADVRPFDCDGDGDLDLVVAEFGWQETGAIFLLRQTKQTKGVPQFKYQKLDDRHGTIHVPVADIDGDGHLDIVALVSQEHEAIEAFINDGTGQFTKRTIFDAKDPSYGSSGIQLVDFDGDSDLDVLYTNGDTLDGYYLKPYHRVQWLENQGKLNFQHHIIAELPGVYRAIAGDLDNDGDLDVVAGAHILDNLKQSFEPGRQFDSLVWFEQDKSGSFKKHTISQVERYGYYALNVVDLDSDGKLDIVAGPHTTPQAKSATWVEVYWNKLAKD